MELFREHGADGITSDVPSQSPSPQQSAVPNRNRISAMRGFLRKLFRRRDKQKTKSKYPASIETVDP
jgi:hypothetical protein